MIKLNIANDELKDGVFRFLFNNQENAAELYYALTGEKCDPTEVEIQTLTTIISGKRQNDLAFLVRDRAMIVGEHQSTVSNNMPARFLIYVGQLYDKWISEKPDKQSIYGTSIYKLPAPELVVFYNGTVNKPAKEILKLSSAFKKKVDPNIFGTIEVEVPVYNINKDIGSELFAKSEKLKHYAELIAKIREFQKIHNYDEAVKKAVSYCITNNILAEFLKKNGGIIMSILSMEYSEEEALKIARIDGRKERDVEIARNLIAIGLSKEQISQGTGLSIEEIENLG